MDVLTIERKTGDTFPVQASIKDAAGEAYPLTNVTEIVLVVSDQKDEKLTEIVEIKSLGAVTVEADGTATFPVPANLAALTAASYSAEIRMLQDGYVRTTNTFKYKVLVRVGASTGL